MKRRKHGGKASQPHFSLIPALMKDAEGRVIGLAPEDESARRPRRDDEEMDIETLRPSNYCPLDQMELHLREREEKLQQAVTKLHNEMKLLNQRQLTEPVHQDDFIRLAERQAAYRARLGGTVTLLRQTLEQGEDWNPEEHWQTALMRHLNGHKLAAWCWLDPVGVTLKTLQSDGYYMMTVQKAGTLVAYTIIRTHALYIDK